MGLLKAGHLTTLRLFHDYFIGETTTIGYDYCWPLLASSESPKRDTARAANGSAPLAAPQLLDCPAGWSVPDCKPPDVGSIETL